MELPLAGLRPWPANPRRISAERLEDLKRALADDPEMLAARPLVALPDGTVMLGNQRLRAARELGWQTIPVLTVDLDPTRARVWALRDNNAWGEWDEPLLSELLRELAAEGVDLLLSGLDSRDLDRLLVGMKAQADPDDAPSLPAEPESQPGEVFQLGRHALLCGDCRNATEVRRLMGGRLADVLVTDPPFGVGIVGRTARRLTIANDDAQGLPALLRQAFAACDGVMAPGARFYVFSPAGPLGNQFRLAVEDVGWQLHQTLCWAKDAFVLGHSDYQYMHEDVLYGYKPGSGRPGRGRHKGSRWYGGNDQGSVLFVDRPKRSELHPTMKPVALVSAMLRNSTRRGDVVLDPFAGSGSTLIACELLGRDCVSVEIDPGYCDVIRHRYQELVDG